MDRSQEHNRRAWNTLAQQGHPFSKPPTEAELRNPLQTLDGLGWLGPSIHGQRVLCLAAGGGRQGALYAAAGAEVTVVDVSERQLEVDQGVADRWGYTLRLIRTSMDDLSMLGDASFDWVVHPVSTCYLPEVEGVFREVHRVLRDGGHYISQHKSPISLQASATTRDGLYTVGVPYYTSEPLPAMAGRSRLRESGTLEYLHRWETVIGGLCRSGFVITDFAEPYHADPAAPVDAFEHRAQYIAPYFRIKARRIPGAVAVRRVVLP